LIRAKALYKQTSVVDEPVNPKIQQELDYATWLAERVASIVDVAERHVTKHRDDKTKHKTRLLAKTGGKVYCSNCKRETKRHYEYCKICGKRQLFLLDRLDGDEFPTADSGEGATAPSKSELFSQQFEGLEGLAALAVGQSGQGGANEVDEDDADSLSDDD
jgi:hypothetical protein